MVYSIDGPLFFAAVETLEHTLQRSQLDPRTMIVRLGRVPFMDITGIQTLEEVIQNLERRGVAVVLCEARSNVLFKLERAGLTIGSNGQPRHFGRLDLALDALAGRSLQEGAPAPS
jgi:SulP family sulfate permease